MLLHYWSLVLDREKLKVDDRFTGLGSYLTNGGSTVIEVSTRVSKARAAYADLKRLWRLPDISQKLKGCVHCAIVSLVPLFGFGI